MAKNCAVILAAGEGKRMKSEKAKVLSQVLFKPMIDWVTDAALNAGVSEICVVTGFMREQVEAHLGGKYKTVVQGSDGYGTGFAVMQAADFIKEHESGNVLILCGDAPFIDSNTITEALRLHESENNAVTVITAKLQNPEGYGRIVREKDHSLKAIVEQNDASEEILKISEVNSGAYWFKADALISVLFGIENSNPKGEYYLTDAVELLAADGKRAGAYLTGNTLVTLGANDRKQMNELNELKRIEILKQHMENGVEIPCLDGVMIDPSVRIGADTVILPGTILRHNVTIGKGSVIGPNTLIENSEIADRVTLNNVQCYQSKIESGVKCGPFVHIRPNSHLKENVHIGDFVEVKNSTVGKSTHISHLTYVGDSDVGERVNFGCGTVTVNYNGVSKSRCTIGDDVFIGCNTNLVAPVKLENNCYTAAGSTITVDVPENALAIERSRQSNIEGWVTRFKEKNKKK